MLFSAGSTVQGDCRAQTSAAGGGSGSAAAALPGARQAGGCEAVGDSLLRPLDDPPALSRESQHVSAHSRFQLLNQNTVL